VSDPSRNQRLIDALQVIALRAQSLESTTQQQEEDATALLGAVRKAVTAIRAQQPQAGKPAIEDPTRILREVVLGQAPVRPDTVAEAAFRQRLEREVEAIKRRGDGVEAPFD
jgi:hypothetical protein